MSHAAVARRLVAGASAGTLSTLALDPAGHPYGSVVAYALCGDAPVLLLSELAEHTRNLRADARASLTVSEAGEAPVLERARVTLLGRARLLDEAAAAVRAAYLAVHPDAARFAGFQDFHFWQLDVTAARYIAGFGRMSWVDAGAWADPIAPHAAAIVAHMNGDHADTLVLYAHELLGAPDATAATMLGVDAAGFDLRLETPAGPRVVHVPFGGTLATPDEVRRALVAMARRARGQGA